jgi:hypothetical protein
VHIRRQIKGIQQTLANVRTCSESTRERVSADAAWDDAFFFGERYRERERVESVFASISTPHRAGIFAY